MRQTLDYQSPFRPTVDRKLHWILVAILICHVACFAYWVWENGGWLRWRFFIVEPEDVVWPVVEWAALSAGVQFALALASFAGVALSHAWVFDRVRTRWLGVWAIAFSAVLAGRIASLAYVTWGIDTFIVGTVPGKRAMTTWDDDKAVQNIVMTAILSGPLLALPLVVAVRRWRNRAGGDRTAQ